ncbi:FkbM family methyltransferase [Paenibacillus qinlingensis]|uniref:FkbM family methyltransferase n=1 Tax=Paenibacillus qinlingensis TaxID=1837343 RepID=A0ABU1P1I1_9BACL|nr:FkbM family methyltransferase [Paenibacillus qinlingensis]MDR6553595.1 FkbM family methyltransferase [Paenibacillus qinlingensis]
MEFLSQIRNVRNVRIEIFNEIQESTYPLLIFGAGEIADHTIRLLEKKQIKINDVFISEGEGNGNRIRGYEVKSLQYILEKYKKVNVIVAFANFKNGISEVKQYFGDVVKSIFVLDDVYQNNYYSYDFVEKNAFFFEQVYNSLSDDLSKKTYIEFINTKISGDPSKLYDYARIEEFYTVDNLITFSEGEVFLDCGTYSGDTIELFYRKFRDVWDKVHVVAFEPDSNNLDLLSNMLNRENINNVEIVPKGVWNYNNKLYFNSDAQVSAVTGSGITSIDVVSIDDYCKELQPITFIKMDIEGAEMEALMGAVETIKKYRPKLAISIYHKPEDIFLIPRFLKMLVPEYKFFVRQHKYISVDLVLYAVI